MFGLPFGSKEDATVVIEIGTDLLKIFQSWEKGRNRFQHFLKMERLAKIEEPLFEAIPKILSEVKLKTKRVLTYLPRNIVNMRLLEVPSTDLQEVADIIKLQGVKQTPYSREEVALSYRITGSRREGHSDVVLAFCQRKFVDEKIDILERSGLKIDGVGVSTEGVLHWYQQYQKKHGVTPYKEGMILIDQDSVFSDIIFCQNEEFIFSKSILAGLNRMEKKLSKETVDAFCEEVAHAVEVTREEIQMESPKKGVLVGIHKEKTRLREALEEKLQIPIDLVNPLQELNPVNDLPQEAGSFTALIGFSDKQLVPSFNLTPEEVKAKQTVEKRGKDLLKSGGLAAAFLVTVLTFFAGHFFKKGDYLKELEKEIAKTDEVASRTEEKSARLRLIRLKRNPSASILSYLFEITKVLPEGIYFDSFSFKEADQIILNGHAKEMSDVFNYVKTLEEMKIFKGVKSEHVSKKKVDQDILAEFEINCRL